MYHRGGDRGWHQRHRRDVFPPRNHQSTPYRGGYQDHRDHDNYGQYNHNASHDRNYDEGQYMEYQEPTYHDYHEENRPYRGKSRPYRGENRPYRAKDRPYHGKERPYHEENQQYHEENQTYHEQRDTREQTYRVRGRHEGGYQKDFHGGYQQSHGESKSQHKKYAYKSTYKPQTKENDVDMKTNTAKPVQSVVHNQGKSVITLVGGSSPNPSETRTVPSQNKNLAQETAKPAQEDAKAVPEDAIPEENNKPTQDETKPVQNGAKDGAKPAQVSAEPLKEYIKLFSENKKPSEEGIKPLDKGKNPTKEDVKVEHEDTEINKQSEEQICDIKPSTTEMTTQLKCLKDTKEDFQTRSVFKEDKQEYSNSGDETQEETFLGKRIRRQDEDQFFVNKSVEIPLLGGWADMPSNSTEAAGTSTKRHSEPVVNYGLSHTAQELRKAFILAKKEEIELAFSQDCRTFAYVASTLLKKDPSLEVSVSNALRSTLQDIAGRCVQEMSKFIDRYDNIPVDISERLQNSDI
ncbi:dentin matrix acidic phosphoprotein 1-like isoform X2 [Rana temporaria]|uniref:dentin matrix acidic phosphoprotein 1-like isoform X2 n=1 Tax=Rana temporaria TaxID=8407 RepID=UPI001AAD5111|nr:dentin matrix acidic phosphoprotein 1-like isoform X2 [Rana temporaria]